MARSARTWTVAAIAVLIIAAGMYVVPLLQYGLSAREEPTALGGILVRRGPTLGISGKGEAAQEPPCP